MKTSPVCILRLFPGLLAAALLLLLLSPCARADDPPDTDADGMPDAWEIMFGLDPQDADDAATDPDSDGLTCLEEYQAGTDPVRADTDRDGFTDGEDSNPVSRAVMLWGTPGLTSGDAYAYPGPDWWTAALKSGGEWAANAWHVPAETPAGTGTLTIAVDREILTTDARLELTYADTVGASLYVDLADDEGTALVSAIGGNLIAGTGQTVTRTLSIPLAANSDGVAVVVRRGAGEITVTRCVLYVDRDGDGLDAAQEAQTGSSDTSADTDGDGLGDAEEVFQHGTDPAVADTDRDGLSDGWEVAHGTDPLGIRPASITGHWRFDETSGATAVDSSPNGNDGTIAGADRVTGRSGRALRFDGQDDQVTIPAANSYRTADLTILAWVRFDAVAGNAVTGTCPDGTMYVLALKNAGGGHAVALVRTAEQALALRVANSAVPLAAEVGTPPGFAVPGRWYEVAAVIDRPSVTLYVNGECIGTAAFDAPIEYDASSGVLFGRGGLASDGFLDGVLDEVRFLASRLESREIAALADAPGDSDTDGLLNLDEMAAGANPAAADSDGDGLSDSAEMELYGCDPTVGDTDLDGLGDAWEVRFSLNPADVAAADLAAWWKLDEASGVTATDSAGDSDGTYDGAAATAGVAGSARLFDGVDDGLTVPAAAAQRPPAFTVVMCARVDSVAGNTVTGSAEDGMMVLAAQPNSGSGFAWALYRTPAAALVFEMADAASATTVRAATPDGFVVPGRWYHLAAAFARPNMSLYVDGEAVASAEFDRAADFATANGPSFGRGGLANDGYFAGALDDLRLYRVAVTAAQAAGLAQAGEDSDGDSLDNWREAAAGSSPYLADTDGDGLSDAAEIGDTQTDPTQADTDGDGMADGWEVAHGLNPNSNDASLDPDGDTLSNLREFQIGSNPHAADTDGDGLSDAAEADTYHTAPTLADTDGDGMTDGWEVGYSLNPRANDACSDADADGLANVEEFILGADPLDADTDSDGVSDGEEALVAFTDPATPDFDGTAAVVAELDASDASDFGGAWERDGTDIVARDRQGWVEYAFDLDTAGACRVEASGTQDNPLTTRHTFPIEAFIDGVRAGAAVLDAPYGTLGQVRFYLPELAEGTHTLRLVWHNLGFNTSLRLHAVEIVQPGGPDADENGIADWRQNRLDIAYGLRDGLPTASAVSPVCIEGRALAAFSVAVLSSFVPEDTPLPVEDGKLVNTVGRLPSDGWYADVPLDADGPTVIEARFEGAARVSEHTVTWTQTNLLTAPDTITIRSGDALLFNACPEGATAGAVEVTIAGETTETTPDAPVPAAFGTPGDYLAVGTYVPVEGDPTTSATVIHVVAAAFDSVPACVPGRPRGWACTDLPPEAVLAADPVLAVAETPLAGGGRLLTLTMAADGGPAYLAARLGEDGPVLAVSRVDAVSMQTGWYEGLSIITVFEDGSQLVEARLTFGFVPDDLEVHLGVATGGVTFDDGTTSRTVTADQFGETGEYRYRLVRAANVPGAVCHTIGVYQNGVEIGF